MDIERALVIRKFFVGSIIVTIFLSSVFSCEAMEDDKFARSHLSSQPTFSTEELFHSFVDEVSRVSGQLKDERIRTITTTVASFATLDCHYLESHEDTAQSSYKEILFEEYFPLLKRVEALDQGTISECDFFCFVLDRFIGNLRDTANQAKRAREEDDKFYKSRGNWGLYRTGAVLNFFRDFGIVPHCEEFLQTDNLELVKYWDPNGPKAKDRKELLSRKAQLSRALREEKEKMQALKDRILPYRDEIEEFYNCLLFQAWSLIPDPMLLAKKTKRMLNRFSYVWPVLTTGKNEEGSLDTLIKEWALFNRGQLYEVFEAAKTTPKKQVKLTPALIPVREEEIPPEFLPRPVEEEMKETSTEDTLSGVCGVNEAELANKTRETVIAEVAAELQQSSREQQKEDDGEQMGEVRMPKKPEPTMLPAVDTPTSFPTLEDPFEDIRRTKHIKYEQVQGLLNKLGGQIIRTRGSHETWELHDQEGNSVKFGFWRLHGKDHYGPWTKKLVLDLQTRLMPVADRVMTVRTR